LKEEEKFKDGCGIFGVFGHREASNLTYLGLYALQHRGQESAGIVSSDGNLLHSYRGMGLVADVFDEELLSRLPGQIAIGHVRYSTTGESLLKNAQPFVAGYSGGGIAIAHNGNLVNAQALRDQLTSMGALFQSTMDTEVIVHLVAHSSMDFIVDKIIDALSQVKGSYCLLFLTEDSLIAARDPFGFRPLVMGTLNGAIVFASETCALDLIEAKFQRDVAPGEIILVNKDGVRSFYPFPQTPKQCIFELIYFARPDSIIFGRNVYAVRKELGRQLAREHPVDADMVIPVPDSGIAAALGFAEEAGIPFDTGLIRNHYVGRTFIEPEQRIRYFGVKVKLNPVKGFLQGKRLVVVDDSIVRGTTSKKIITMLRNSGAKEIHQRISSPPTLWSCYYGIDTPTREELIASSHTIEEIREYLTADSLGYISIEGMLKAVGNEGKEFCHACFSGEYPVEVKRKETPHQLILFREAQWKEMRRR
jgi:amidophosphoribosyltransferase